MYFWSVYIHILMAMFWIGGMIFTAAVLVPASWVGRVNLILGLIILYYAVSLVRG